MSRMTMVCGLLCCGVWLSGCGGSATTPTVAPATASLSLGSLSPASGATISVAEGAPPGAFILRNSGQLSVPVTFTTGAGVPWAQLYVFLLSGDDYCGQNLPDAPTWSPLAAGQTVSLTVTGFQVYRLPCEVTGLRAVLHTRNSGLLTPPTAAETVAEATVAVSYHLTP